MFNQFTLRHFIDHQETDVVTKSDHGMQTLHRRCIPSYYRKLTLHEIKVLEINANLMENDFRIKKINAKEEVEFHDKGN